MNWHHHLGYKICASIQQLFRTKPFTSHKFEPAKKCELPRCEICEYTKAHRKPKRVKMSNADPIAVGSLKARHLGPGSVISVDHFESRLKRRTYNSYGKTNSDQYVGGCIFVDHMSGYIHVEPQLDFSSSEIIRAFVIFENLCIDNEILVESYPPNNRIFKGKYCIRHIRESNQRI